MIPIAGFAWGEKGHYLVNEAATWQTPTDMPSFFHDSYASLVYLGYDPDRIRNGGDSIDAFNPPNHFLDYEYVASLDAPPVDDKPGGFPRSRYAYVDSLYTTGILKRYSIAATVPGFLPWQIAEMSELLVVQWRLWRRSEPDSVERRQIEQNIIHVAGTLGHFAGDAANPHHTTINYNGWVSDNPHGFAIDCDTHSRFESQFISQSIALSDVVPRVATPRLREDYFAAGMELIKESNSLVERLYQIDQTGGFGVRGGTAEAKEFGASRVAAGASLLRDLWWSTWVNSEKSSSRR